MTDETKLQRRKRWYYTVACLGLIFSGLTVASPVYAADEVVARVGNSDITASEVHSYLDTLDPKERNAITADPKLLNQAVRLLVARDAVLKQALSKKWDQQASVAAQIKLARENVITESYLQSVTTPPDSFPADADVQSAYDANKTAFLAPRQFHLAQIFVALPKGSDKATEDKAHQKLDAIEQKLKQPNTDFGAVAQTDSDDAVSAKKSGEIAWVFENQLRPEIRGAAAGLQKDGVSDPLQLEDGWHIIKLLDTKPSYTRSLSEVRDQLVQRLRANQAMVNRRAYLEKLMGDKQASVNEAALSKLLTKPQQ